MSQSSSSATPSTKNRARASPNSNYRKSPDESTSDERASSRSPQTRSAANESQTFASAVVLGVNLWSEQKNREQLAFITLPKIQKIRANGASDKNWSGSRVQDTAVFFCLGQKIQNNHRTKAEQILISVDCFNVLIMFFFYWPPQQSPDLHSM